MTVPSPLAPATLRRPPLPGHRLRCASHRLVGSAPLATPASSEAATPRPVALAASRPRILLAEDDAALRTLLAAALRRQGHAVTEVGDGAGAIADLRPWLAVRRGTPPDAIISDIRMPGAGGLDLLTAVRHARLTMPIILITAFGATDTHAAAHRLGATAVLDKPFAADTLCRLVRDALATA